jgi:two-component system sensor histidine kinase AlgZ
VRSAGGQPEGVAGREEQVLAKRYLSIEQYRLGKRLQLDWGVDLFPGDLPIPQLTLQPLLASALIHGVAPRFRGGRVSVEGDYQEGEFILSISNPDDEASVRHVSGGTHQALENIGAQLAALFGPLASLSVDHRDGRYITCLRYPCARLTQESSAL